MDDSYCSEPLTARISSLDFKSEAQPGCLLLTGSKAFPVVVNSSNQVLVAASTLGRGRVVVLSHESHLTSPAFHQLVLNCISWLSSPSFTSSSSSSSPCVALGKSLSGSVLKQLLLRQGLRVSDEPAALRAPRQEAPRQEAPRQEAAVEHAEETVSVLCTDAHSARDWGALGAFVRRGGGLLIGGQACDWAGEGGREAPGDPLVAFPANGLLATAMIMMGRERAEKEVVDVAAAGLLSEAAVVHSYRPCCHHDYKTLRDAIGNGDFTLTSGQPSQIIPHGPLSFPLLVNPDGHCVAACSRYGLGRIMALGHECLATPGPAAVGPAAGASTGGPALLGAAMAWLAQGSTEAVGIPSRSNLNGIKATLADLGITNVIELKSFPSSTASATSSKPTSPNLSVLCCSAYGPFAGPESNESEVRAIQEFVERGGGLLIAGQAWWWASSHSRQNPLDDYPGNHVINKMGLTITAAACNGNLLNVAAAPPPDDVPLTLRQACREFSNHLAGKTKVSSPYLKTLASTLDRDLIPLLGAREPTFRPFRVTVEEMLKPFHGDLALVSAGKPVEVNDAVTRSLVAMVTALVKGGGSGGGRGRREERGALETLSLGDVFPGKPVEPTYRGWHQVTVDISSHEGETWVTTGLYVPPGQRVFLRLPSTALNTGIQVQVGCHRDHLPASKPLRRHPDITQCFPLAMPGKQGEADCTLRSAWGGLLYLLVPNGVKLGTVSVAAWGAVKAPCFKMGHTDAGHWRDIERHFPSPWGEISCRDLIVTVPSSSLRTLPDPEEVMSLWTRIMEAMARLAAEPYLRPERIILDEQIGYGWMHAGYPIMAHLGSLKTFLNVKEIMATGTWGFVHELGHNRQRASWNFPAYTGEATTNIFSVYVHEEVLGICRELAHSALQAAARSKRIRDYVAAGRPLEQWTVWTCLETYLQLQEGFGWAPFIQLLRDYQGVDPKLDSPQWATSSPPGGDTARRMNGWIERFSRHVKRNLSAFFKAWGWPVHEDLASALSEFPNWEENPMKGY